MYGHTVQKKYMPVNFCLCSKILMADLQNLVISDLQSAGFSKETPEALKKYYQKLEKYFLAVQIMKNGLIQKLYITLVGKIICMFWPIDV